MTTSEIQNLLNSAPVYGLLLAIAFGIILLSFKKKSSSKTKGRK